jgi:hypothetical protein
MHDMATYAGHPDDGVDEGEDPLNILDRHDLPVMIFLHVADRLPPEKAFYNTRGLVEIIQPVDEIIPVLFQVIKELSEELLPAQIIQQILAVV